MGDQMITLDNCEQWERTIDKFINREIYRIEFENVDGKLHSWVYFKEGE